MGYSLGLLSGPHDPNTQRVPVAPLPSPRTPTRRSRRSNSQIRPAMTEPALTRGMEDWRSDPLPKVHPRFLELHVEVVLRKTLPKPCLALHRPCIRDRCDDAILPVGGGRCAASSSVSMTHLNASLRSLALAGRRHREIVAQSRHTSG